MFFTFQFQICVLFSLIWLQGDSYFWFRAVLYESQFVILKQCMFDSDVYTLNCLLGFFFCRWSFLCFVKVDSYACQYWESSTCWLLLSGDMVIFYFGQQSANLFCSNMIISLHLVYELCKGLYGNQIPSQEREENERNNLCIWFFELDSFGV